jgi:hypothetical protein
VGKSNFYALDRSKYRYHATLDITPDVSVKRVALFTHSGNTMFGNDWRVVVGGVR